MKSLTCCVFWPMWEWTWMPWMKYLFGSYTQDFAIRDSKRCRQLIESEEYKEDHGHIFSLLHDTNRQDLFGNDQSGYRQSVGVGGGHGKRFDRAIADDPINPQEAESPTTLAECIRWWTETIPNRAQTPGKMANIIVMQRLAKKDLIGEVVARGLGYEMLVLPMKHEKAFVAQPTKIGFVDPRKEEGELLFPQRMPAEFVAATEKKMGVYGTAAQHQMRPIARGSDMKLFSRIRFEQNIRKEPPKGLTLVRYWDKAFTSGGGAYTVGVLMGRTKTGEYWILDVRRGQWGNDVDDEYLAKTLAAGETPIGYRDRMIRECAKADKAMYGNVKTWLEREPGPQGRDSCKVLIKLLAGYPVEDDPVKEDKMVRAGAYSSQQLAGNVYLIEAEWNETFIAEHEAFPDGLFKDQVDGGSGAFNKLALGRSWQSFSPSVKLVPRDASKQAPKEVVEEENTENEE